MKTDLLSRVQEIHRELLRDRERILRYPSSQPRWKTRKQNQIARLDAKLRVLRDVEHYICTVEGALV